MRTRSAPPPTGAARRRARHDEDAPFARVADAPAFRRALLAWYRRNRRRLPWRDEPTPYRVWVSELMLQQTRVETVRPYFERFIELFPDEAALAAAPLERVLHAWQGLGYYSRARSLHAAARQIAERGAFPQSAAEWRALPGVGRYTAAAIASISGGEAVAALDGNIKRVLARVLRVEQSLDGAAVVERLWQAAEALLAQRRAGDFNQAMMELGATVCTPRAPRCERCPVHRFCRAAEAGVQGEIPQPRARRAAPIISALSAAIWRGGRLLLVRRPERGLLGGLWELPGAECGEAAPPGAARDWLAARVRAALGVHISIGRQVGQVRHVFSHRDVRVRIYDCCWTAGEVRARRHVESRWVTPNQLSQTPLATFDRKIVLAALRWRRPDQDPPGT